jgi:hypothetical protein
MAADARRRAEEIDKIATMLDSVGDEYLDWKGQLFPTAEKVYAYVADAVAQAIEEERIRHGECHDCYVKKAGL